MLLPGRLHGGRELGARSPSRFPASSATAPSLETKLPTLNQSLSATLPPPHPTRGAAPRGPRAQLSARAPITSCVSPAAAMPGLRRVLLSLWAALGLGFFGLTGKSPSLFRVDREGVSGAEKRPHAPPGSALARLPRFCPHLEPWAFFSLFPNIHLTPFKILGALPHSTSHPGDSMSPLFPPGVPPHALLCTMVHGLASFPLAAHEDPISPTAVIQRRCSRSTWSLGNRVPRCSRGSFHEPSPASSFRVLHPGLESSLILDSASSPLCPGLNLSLPLSR